MESVEQLSHNPYPSGVKKLVGSEQTYRIRVGVYRVVFSVEEAELIIEIIRVRHRKDSYRGI